ncbi:MAG: prepilin-type N-terminal cleavage/methylation domain-containing protein [Verrucomicrobiales bacterium]|nr:prepilin-type N-terminal cleavage/methylation domain-containing protein [Verrucomicrobiales bacterium]
MKNTKKALNKGFSLVEMLVVIAVIGIIAAIAVPNIGKINDSAKESKNRRNAQSIASVFASAQAAGLNFYVDADKDATVAAIVTGGTVTDEGPFKGTFFGVPNMSAGDQDAALPYLSMDDTNDILTYVGVQNAVVAP